MVEPGRPGRRSRFRPRGASGIGRGTALPPERRPGNRKVWVRRKDQSNREVTVQGDFSHMDDMGNVRMVDVSGKPVSKRRAVASGVVRMSASTVGKLREGALRKGDALGSARIAGIMAAKRTSELIPLCHPLPIDDIDVRLSLEAERVVIEAAAVSTARTGVEMEALTAVAVAALTVYDMCKAVDRGMVIDGIELVSKTKEEV